MPERSDSALRDVARGVRQLFRTATQTFSIDHRRKLVRNLYKGCLRREPNDTELSHWSDVLLRLPPADAVGRLLDSAEFKKPPNSETLYVPPGHFFSPIVDRAEANAYLQSLAPSYERDSVSGISIDRKQMVAMWHKLLPLMTSAPFADKPTGGLRYGFDNPAYSWGDGSILHAMLRLNRPRKLIEIGCGWSSACSLDTVDLYLAGECDLTFIEPYTELLNRLLAGEPGANVHILESAIQQVPVALFESLGAGDILFIDSTHVLRTGSDVCYELFEILPRLPSGVLVHFHDVFWPFEYPWNWIVEENRSWNEVYAIRAFLTENSAWQVVMFNNFMARFERDLVERTYPAFYKNTGGALWIQKR